MSGVANVCLVVPCFNEGARLPVNRFAADLKTADGFDFCFVNDGSTDATSRKLEGIRAAFPDRVAVVTLVANQGKAEAVRQGILHALSWRQFEFVGYWDADLATPLSEVARLIAAMREHPECQLALGSRVKRLGAIIERSAARHVVGRTFATLASGLLEIPVYDSQCGAKLLRAPAAASLFADPFVTRWLFDLELLTRLMKRQGAPGLDAALEVPLGEWRDVRGSKLGLASMIRAPFELFRIRRHYGVIR